MSERPALVHRAGVILTPLALLPLACAVESNLPVENDAAIGQAAAQMLAGCTAALTEDGRVDEAALTAAGWVPVRRTASTIVTENNSTGMRDRAVPAAVRTELADAQSYESSVWQHAGVAAGLELSRNGGSLNERSMDECRLALRGDDGTAADVGALVARVLGAPTASGIRSGGGDWLTPRWFEPDMRVRYWRRPSHDVYWVSDRADHAAVEVVAMPDRAALDQWSTSRPEAKFVADDRAERAAR